MTILDERSEPAERSQPATAKPVFEGNKRHGEQLALYLVVIIPFLAFLAAIPVAWGWGLGWTDVILFAIFYWGSGLGITVGYHRLFTHNSFKANRGLRAGLAIAGSFGIEGPMIRWVADHRRHHMYSDRDGDPHSPWRYGETFPALMKGFAYAHIGWMFDETAHEPGEVHARPAGRQGPQADQRPVPAVVRALAAAPAGHRRARHDVLGRRAVGVLLGLAGAGVPAAPRHVVDQLDLPHDRRPAVPGAGQERQRLAARHPQLRRELPQHAPRRPDRGPARRAARSARHVGPADLDLREARLGHRRPLAEAGAHREAEGFVRLRDRARGPRTAARATPRSPGPAARSPSRPTPGRR